MSVRKKNKPAWNDAKDVQLKKLAVPRFGPTWEHDFKYPLRLENFRYGVIYNHDAGMSLSGATAALTDFELRGMRDSGFDHVAYSFTIEEAATGRNNPKLPQATRDTIALTLRRFREFGFGVILKPDSTGQARQDLCGDNGAVGVWTQANYNQFLINLYDVASRVPGISPETLWIGTGNEMGLDCANRSMTYYNGFLASAVPALRAAARDYTILYDLYPTATPLDWQWDSYYAVPPSPLGTYVELVPPPGEKNALPGGHDYWQNMFALDQGNSDTSPSGMRWIFGFPWGLNRAALSAWFAAHPPAGYHTGNAALDAQYDWWNNPGNLANVVDADGLTLASMLTRVSGLIAWATRRRVPLHITEHGTASIEQSANFTPAEVDLTNFTRAKTAMWNGYGVGNCQWQWKNLADGNAGERIPNQTKLARNAARRSITNGIRSY